MRLRCSPGWCHAATLIAAAFLSSCQHVNSSSALTQVSLPDGICSDVWLSSDGQNVACWIMGYKDSVLCLNAVDFSVQFHADVGFPTSVGANKDLTLIACLGSTTYLIDTERRTCQVVDAAVVSDRLSGKLLALPGDGGWISYRRPFSPLERDNISLYEASSFALSERYTSVQGDIKHCAVDDDSGLLVIVSAGRVYRMELGRGPPREVSLAGGSLTTDVVAGAGVALFGMRDGYVAAVDVREGVELWRERVADRGELRLNLSGTGKTLGAVSIPSREKGADVMISVWKVARTGLEVVGRAKVTYCAPIQGVAVADRGPVLFLEPPHLYVVDLAE